MGLFGKKKEAQTKCGCQGSCSEGTTQQASDASILVLGGGCAKCNELEAATKEALAELDMDTTVGHVTDFVQIAAYGVMTTPALVVDGKVVSYGKVLNKKQIVSILQKVRGQQ